MKLFISFVALIGFASAMPMTQNQELAQASENIKGKLEDFFKPYVSDYQQAAEDVRNDIVQIYENDNSAASKAQSVLDLIQAQLDENNVNVNLAAHQNNANSQINNKVDEIKNIAENKFGKYVQQSQQFGGKTLGGLLGQGFDLLSNQINNNVVNNDLQNALNSLSGSLQNSASQALGQNAGLSLTNIGQQVGNRVLSDANSKYGLQDKLNKVQQEFEQ